VANSTVRIGLLGPLEVELNGRLVELGQPKQRLVLAMLALAVNHIVSVDVLIDNLWGDNPPAHPAGSVQVYVANLRRILEPTRRARTPASVLVSQAPGYLLRVPPDNVDAQRFTRLVGEAQGLSADHPAAALERFDGALALWRGPVAADLLGAPWLIAPAGHLEQIRASAIEERFEIMLRLGRHTEIAADLADAAAADPLRERLWELLIVCLYRCSRQADALAAYQQIRRRLAEDLGIDPGPTLRTLERQVLDQDPVINATRPSPELPSLNIPVAPVDPSRRRALVGRDRELALLTEMIGRLTHGHGGAVLISGPPGVGKTRLAEAATAHTTGVTVAWGRCVDVLAAPAFWPWLEVATDLGPTGFALATALTDATVDNRTALDRAIIEGIRAAADAAPLVIVIDDAQWADAPSQQIIQLLLTRIQQNRLLLVIAVRDETPRPELDRTLAALARSPATERIELTGLDHDAIAAYLRHADVTVDEGTVELLAQRSGGNPFFLTELTRLLPPQPSDRDPRTLREAMPDSVAAVIRHRVTALAPDAVRLLTYGALIGRVFDWRVVTRAAEAAEAGVLDVLESALVNGILDEEAMPTRCRFAHDIVREALVHMIPGPRRPVMHAGIVRALVQIHGHDGGHANEIATHAWDGRHALDADTVAGLLLVAADVASATFAHEQAEIHLRRLLTLLDEPHTRASNPALRRDATTRLAMVLSFGDHIATPEAAQILADAHTLHTTTGQAAAGYGRVLLGQAMQATARGESDVARSTLAELESHGRAAGDLAETGGAHSVWALIELRDGRLAAAEQRLRAAQADIDRCDPDRVHDVFGNDARGGIGSMLGFVLALRGNADAKQITDAAIARVNDNDPIDGLATAFWSGWHAVVETDPATAARMAGWSESLLDKVPVAIMAARTDVLGGWSQAHAGDMSGGLARLRHGRGTAIAMGDRLLLAASAALEAETCLTLNQVDQVLALTELALFDAEASGDQLWRSELHRLRAEALAATEAPRSAIVQDLLTAETIATQQGAPGFLSKVRKSQARLVR
jgi:DNA-binding SARP family transcriptional activator